jgi:hypothetical protein
MPHRTNFTTYWTSTAIALVILSGAAMGQSDVQDSAMSVATIRQLAAGMVKEYMAWGPNLNSPGIELNLKEVSREGGKFVYSLYAHGLPRDHTYTMVQWPVTQSHFSNALSGVTFDESGLAICQGKPGTCGEPAKPNDPIQLVVFPAKGEPFRFGIITTDDPKLRALVKVVPVPNVAEDKGCRLEAVLLMPHAELILLQATKFAPNARLTMTGDSEGEIHKSQPTSDARGEYTSALMPAKAELKSGTIKIRLEGPTCSPQVSVDWANLAVGR